MAGEVRLYGPPGIARRTADAAIGHGERKEVADDGSAVTRAMGVGRVLLTLVLRRSRALAQGNAGVRGQGEGEGTLLPPGGSWERTCPA